jgi:hypothetical protein
MSENSKGHGVNDTTRSSQSTPIPCSTPPQDCCITYRSEEGSVKIRAQKSSSRGQRSLEGLDPSL